MEDGWPAADGLTPAPSQPSRVSRLTSTSESLTTTGALPSSSSTTRSPTSRESSAVPSDKTTVSRSAGVRSLPKHSIGKGGTISSRLGVLRKRVRLAPVLEEKGSVPDRSSPVHLSAPSVLQPPRGCVSRVDPAASSVEAAVHVGSDLRSVDEQEDADMAAVVSHLEAALLGVEAALDLLCEPDSDFEEGSEDGSDA